MNSLALSFLVGVLILMVVGVYFYLQDRKDLIECIVQSFKSSQT